MFRGQTTSQLPNACILIDDGWGDLFLGVVIGALKLPARRYMERRIPVSSFQPHPTSKINSAWMTLLESLKRLLR
jgi:hypothetical protein